MKLWISQKYFSSLDGSYNMKYFLLNVTDSIPHLQNRYNPPFYLKCTDFLWTILRIAVNEPTNARDIMGQILGHNRFIKSNGKSLDFIHLANCELIRVEYVLDYFKWCPNNIKRKLRITSNLIFQFEILRKANPKRWTEILADTDVTVAFIRSPGEDVGHPGL